MIKKRYFNNESLKSSFLINSHLINRYFNKRGQDSSIGLSFGMIFSIILIVIFIAAAFIVIKVFLDFSGSTDIGQYYIDLQSEVNSAWRSSETSRMFKVDLDTKITHICFANLSKPITGKEEFYKEIQNYQYYEVNTFLIPSGAAGELDIKLIEHIDIEKITEKENPYCIKNPGEMRIYKGLRSRLVAIE
jgi:hypothetical protein